MSGARIGSPYGFRDGINYNSLYGTIYYNQLLNGLQMCLDAGDATSWNGRSTWQDIGPNFLGFNPVGSVPQFNGSVGGCSGNETFTFNGSNGWTCASGIPTFAQNIHKSGAVFSFFVAVNFPSWQQDKNYIMSTFINGSPSTPNQPLGFRYEFGHNSSGLLDFQVGQNFNSGTGPVFSKSSDSSLSLNTWHIIGLSMNVPGNTGFFYKDGSLDTSSFSASYNSPASSNDPANFTIGSNNVSGTKMAFVGIWNLALAKTDFDTLFGVLRGRFGI